MSTALASARRRRAGPETVAPATGFRQSTTQPSFPGPTQNQPQSNMGVGLTLPQVIAVVDKRLMTLETFMHNKTAEMTRQESSPSQIGLTENFKEVLDEFASRFDIIADELASLKDTIMKLQTYTMEVNKTLMEDRIRILSDEPTPLESALNEV
jgi:hypothetical protein